jgi:ABC-type multidrug transport system ATPase subunit
MGICTQYNIIFDYLTVEEHLKLFAKVKGVTTDITEEID